MHLIIWNLYEVCKVSKSIRTLHIFVLEHLPLLWKTDFQYLGESSKQFSNCQLQLKNSFDFAWTLVERILYICEYSLSSVIVKCDTRSFRCLHNCSRLPTELLDAAWWRYSTRVPPKYWMLVFYNRERGCSRTKYIE